MVPAGPGNCRIGLASTACTPTVLAGDKFVPAVYGRCHNMIETARDLRTNGHGARRK
jgi:hypothetical protein